MGFENSNIAYTLDALGQRYHCRPSQILNYHPRDGRGLLFDIRIMQHALQMEQEASTLGGQIKAKRSQWNPEIRRELKREGYLF